jgi:hypothetical protein
MDENTTPVKVTFTVDEIDDIAKLFIGYEDTDGTEFVLATMEPPAIAELKGTRPQSGETP